MRLHLSLCCGFALFSLLACEQKKPPPPPPEPATPGAMEEAFGLEAGTLDPSATDPLPPAGDFKAEVDAFKTVNACVAEHAKLDPLLGDALRAIGYDTILRDSCRVLEAAKEKSREKCSPIASGALRSRCEAIVAYITGNDEACPLVAPGSPSQGRDPTCLAIALRDPRLCNALGLLNRIQCDALVTKDENKCRAILEPDRSACIREVSRMKSIALAPLTNLPALPKASAKIQLDPLEGTKEPPEKDFDATSSIARGIVLLLTDGTSAAKGLPIPHGKTEFGDLIEPTSSTYVPSPQGKTRLAFSISLGAEKDGIPSAEIEHAELSLPGESMLVSPGTRCECKVVLKKFSKERGGEISATFDGTFGTAPRVYKVHGDFTTFARDVVMLKGIAAANAFSKGPLGGSPRKPGDPGY